MIGWRSAAVISSLNLADNLPSSSIVTSNDCGSKSAFGIFISPIKGRLHRQTPCYGLTAGLRVTQIEPALISESTGYVKPHSVSFSYCLPLLVAVIFRSQPHLRHIRSVLFIILFPSPHYYYVDNHTGMCQFSF